MNLRNVLDPRYVYEHRDLIKPTLRNAFRQGIQSLKRTARNAVRAIPIWLAVHMFPITSNERKLAALKDKHKGHRCFIIGNGPSLRINDLDMLKGEITFASNKIYLAFDQTEWRPTYYSLADVLVAENNYKIISELNLAKIFTETVRLFFEDEDDVLWVKELSTPLINGDYECGFSRNIIRGVYGGWTVIYHQIQLAVYMGIREIYLIGVDFKFNISAPTGELSRLGEVVLENRGEINHFHPNYRKAGEKWTMPRLELQRKAFLVAKETTQRFGGSILNASRESALDVFPRVDFDTIITVNK